MRAVVSDRNGKYEARYGFNPPPADEKCEVCGKTLDELKPFGKAGDPLVGDLDGALLVKTFRRMAPLDKEVDQIIEEFCGGCKTQKDYDKAQEMMVKRYGEEKTDDIVGYAQLMSTVSASWECRDCICLDSDEYFEKLRERSMH